MHDIALNQITGLISQKKSIRFVQVNFGYPVYPGAIKTGYNSNIAVAGQNKKRVLTNLEVIMYTETLYCPSVGHGLSEVSIFLIFNIFLSSTLHLILF